MEFGETEKEKVNSEVPWIPTTPFKPIAQRPVQICTSGEGNQLNSHFNGEFAFLESSAGGNVNNRLDSEAGTSNIGHDNARTRVQVSFNDIPGPSNSFAELLAQAGAPSAYLNSRYGFLENQFVSGMWNSQFDQSYALLGNHNLYQQQPYTNFVHDNYQDPRGTSYMTYYGQTNSQVALPPENVVTGKDKQVVETQICMDQREHEDNASATMCDKSHNKVYDPVVVDLTSIPTPCKEDNNNNKEIHHIIDLNEIPQTKPKRRKHRPKVIREGKPKKTRKPATPRPDQSKENSTQKRKYVRKKDSNTTPAEVTGERTEPLMPESAKKTCRRSLYFEMPEEPRDGNYACREENATMQFGGETGIEVQETQALNNYMSSREDAQASTSNGKFSSDRSQEVGSKRKPSGAIKQADNGSVNLIGAQYNLLQAYQSRYWVQFPNVQKKRRSEKGKFSNTSNTSSMTATKDVQLATCSEENARSYQGASTSNGWTAASASEYETAKLLTMLRAAESATCDKSQSLEYNLFSGQSRPTKKRSRVTNRAHDYTSLAIIRNCDAKLTNIANQSSSDRKTFEEAQRPQTGIDALVAEMRASLTKKKRSKKRTAPISSVYSSRDEMQQHIPLHSSLGVARGESWKSIYTVDTLTQQFSQLSIYREARELVLYDQNALVSYKQKTEKCKGRRVHEYGTIIPYEGVFDPIKKQRPRPKVDLDEETNKVWKLLMLDINSHGVDGTDEDKAKWWENERNVFRGRAESFIARMHLVQGDRRFSRWKGSVVDSVVGVFLTQNVSDHLSSSAFMSLAARFPVKPSSKYDTCHDESASMIVNSPEVQIVEPEENAKLEEILNQSVHELSSMTKDITEHPEERETVDSNSIDSCGTTGSLKDESNCKMSEPAQRNISEHSTVEFVSPVIGEGQENSCNGVVRKELNALFSSHCSIVTSQLSGDFSIDQNPEKIGSVSDSNTEVEDRLSTAEYNVSNRTSFSNLLGMASSTQLHEVNSQSQRNNLTENLRDPYGQPVATRHDNLEENLEKSNVNQSYIEVITTQCNDYNLKMTPNSEVLEVNCYNPVNVEASSSGSSKNKNEDNISLSSPAESHSLLSQAHLQQHSDHKQHEAFHISGQSQDLMPKSKESDSCDHSYAITNENSKLDSAPVKSKGKKEKKDSFNWDSLRVQALATAGEREKTESTKDSLDWDAVRRANVNEIADAIKERGMNNMLAERIQSFLNLLVDKHGGIDLEWLRDVPPDQAKEFLLSIRGLGLKSVECVRLLTLHHLAFPVDTNVGRIAVRLGWVPLQPLPESLQLHLLELYPVLESIQKYLWPRLCKLDQRTLYELHYQLITFGKVFCTKSKPNCNACPMRGECRHFASAFASARLALPGPEQKNLVIASGNNATDQNPSVIINRSPLPLPEPEQKDIDMTSGNNATDQNPSVIINHLSLPLPEQEQNNIDMTTGNNTTDQNPSVIINQLPLSLPENTNQAEELLQTVVVSQLGTNSEINICQPIIEEPASPEPECSHVSDNDIEDAFYEESDEIPTIKLDLEEFTVNLQNYMQTNMELQEGEMSKALVALNQEAAYIPTPKLKNVSRLRTEHSVYELPDSHCLLEGWEVREPDDPGKYLLAIWTPGETANSIQPPERKCSAQGCGQLCNEEECFSCNSFREASAQMVRGTILIPCRTAMRGSFPLNGTYFQVNEVFADHESSLNPISVPRSWIWNLNRRTVHFGTSIPSIFKGLSTQEIQQCFWRGFVCVRGFDRQTRAPRPLKARLHFPASKLAKNKEQAKKDSKAANSQPQPANSQGLNLKSNTEQQPEFLASLPNLQPNGGS